MISEVTLRRNSVMRRRYANQLLKHLRYVGRLFVKGTGKPTEILAKLNELVGFAPDEDIELFEAVLSFRKLNLNLMLCVSVLIKKLTFRASQLEDGDIICSLFSRICSKLSGCALSLAGETQGGCQNSTIMTMLLKELHDLSLDNPSKIRLASNNCYSRQPKPQPVKPSATRPDLCYMEVC
ncbi:ubiquitin carboxyl-terminal hydrolase 12-like protein isoform X2 [Tanacetum coccineum]|uniref:Ubiquitin carboxyl-terminal hydrolase 12-like protein isoform X2 n=1 Tax=Tanacetum coccineum TaxID=301880 RepID=A0ABQ5H946_9ASTR